MTHQLLSMIHQLFSKRIQVRPADPFDLATCHALHAFVAASSERPTSLERLVFAGTLQNETFEMRMNPVCVILAGGLCPSDSPGYC
jgi:hypothetical protein